MAEDAKYENFGVRVETNDGETFEISNFNNALDNISDFEFNNADIPPYRCDIIDNVSRELKVPKKIRKKYHSPKRQKEEFFKFIRKICTHSFRSAIKTYAIGEIKNGDNKQ